jgi:hypothetical protein
MPETIKVPSTLYARLAKHARGFDTPANVIEMLLNAYEGVSPDLTQDVPNETAISPTRKYEKYIFEGQEYGKGRLVLAVITAHVRAHPNTTFDSLMATFPKRLQGSTRGVFDTQEKAEEIFNREGRKRHFLNSDEVIKLSNGVIAVSTQWGVNTDNFIDHAKTLGYAISRVRQEAEAP